MAYQWFISKKTIILQGFWGGGGVGGSPTFSRRVQLFPGGSNFFQEGVAGVQMLILATQRTVNFQEGGADPLSHPSGSAHVAI